MDWNCQFHNLLASFWHILCLFSPILSHQWLKMQTIARTNFALVLFLTVREYLARSYKFENCSCCCDLCSNTSRKASNTHLLHQVLHGFPESLWKSLKVSKITESLESLWKSLKITESLESLWKSLKITESFWKSCTFHLTVKHSKRVLSLVWFVNSKNTKLCYEVAASNGLQLPRMASNWGRGQITPLLVINAIKNLLVQF